MIFFVAIAGYWLWAPITPIVIKAAVAPTPQATGLEGTVTYAVSYCKSTNDAAVVSRTIVGVGPHHYSYPLPSLTSNVPIGCHNDVQITVRAGQPIKPGRYFVRSDISYDVNPIRTVHELLVTNIFVVTN